MPKGFNPPTTNDTRYVAVELNQEDLEADEVIDLVQIHHLELRTPTSPKDLRLINIFSDAISDGCSVISPIELITELYVATINDYALANGANVARIYHNSKLGDTKIRQNSVIHIFEAGQPADLIPFQAKSLLRKYLKYVTIADGDNVTFRDRLGKYSRLLGRDILSKVTSPEVLLVS